MNHRNNIGKQSLKDALSERYLAYALSTITARSLPDVRDGLKPVHRRLVHAMAELKLNPESGFKKCARIVGDVMGKYHPHGDSAIYDAMVRMAQEFSLRYPLVDGQGNFGNIDGDNAAAMRYTEARMSQTAYLLLRDLHRNAVDFRATYDGEGKEPEILPAAFPNLLANGAQGIAVGMATHIPPHNIHELCDALIMLVRNPNINTANLIQHIPGPDFPTGGVLIEDKAETLKAYHTGRGSFRLRAFWRAEPQKGGSYYITITEIPFQVQKSKLIEKIAELMQARKLPLISDIRDESAEDLRIIIQPKNRSVEPKHIMATLFKQTDLEIKFSLNMNVLDLGKVPKIMSLGEVLQKWLSHRCEVMVRCNQFRLEEIATRLNILTAYLIAYKNLDLIIKIIRKSDDPRPELMKQLKIEQPYADTILAMRLSQLRNLEEQKIIQEERRLRSEERKIKQLLASKPALDSALEAEIIALKKSYDQPEDSRRTKIEKINPETEFVPHEILLEREPLTVLYSAKDWVRSVKTHMATDYPHRFKDGDHLRFSHHCYNTDQFLIFSSAGKSYLLSADKFPTGRGMGEPIRLMLDLEAEDKIVEFTLYAPEKTYLLASDDGHGFLVSADKLSAQTRSGKQIMLPKKNAKLVACLEILPDCDYVALLGTNRRLLSFGLDEISTLNRGQGVVLQKYKDARLADIQLFNSKKGILYKKGNKLYSLEDYHAWHGKRAQVGKLPPPAFPLKNGFNL